MRRWVTATLWLDKTELISENEMSHIYLNSC